MKTTTTNNRSWTTAITFAEAGEWETARSFIPVSRRNPVVAWFENLCMAVTFAEHGMQDEAVRIHGRERDGNIQPADAFLELFALGNDHCPLGVLSPGAPGGKQRGLSGFMSQVLRFGLADVDQKLV